MTITKIKKNLKKVLIQFFQNLMMEMMISTKIFYSRITKIKKMPKKIQKEKGPIDK